MNRECRYKIPLTVGEIILEVFCAMGIAACGLVMVALLSSYR